MAEDPGISWHVETHEHKERSIDWYWGLGLVALAAAALSIFFGNTLFALIIGLAAISIGILIARGPREHVVSVSPRGFSLDGTLYRWSGIQSFWITQEREPHLLLTTQGVLHPQLVIPIGDPGRIQNLRAYLRRFCAEEEQEAHLGHHVASIFGL